LPLPRVHRFKLAQRLHVLPSQAAPMPQVLGIRPDTSSETMQRAYKKRLSEAKGDKARVAAVEEAHSRIMMSNLSARLKVHQLSAFLRAMQTREGCIARQATCIADAQQFDSRIVAYWTSGADVYGQCVHAVMQGGGLKEVKYADKAVYLPWRPRSAPYKQISPALCGCSFCVSHYVPGAGCTWQTGNTSS
jgi:hypothetical protein